MLQQRDLRELIVRVRAVAASSASFLRDGNCRSDINRVNENGGDPSPASSSDGDGLASDHASPGAPGGNFMSTAIGEYKVDLQKVLILLPTAKCVGGIHVSVKNSKQFREENRCAGIPS